jgi:hypothetical protein
LGRLFVSAYFVVLIARQKKELKMGKSMYDFGNQAKEKARQQKQIEKASQRIMAKQRKANIKTHILKAASEIADQGPAEETII